jgi:hypothetical protein
MMAAAQMLAMKGSKSGRGRVIAPPVVVDTRDAVRDAKARSRAAATVGFGCPSLSDWPHHVVVAIPAGRGGDIRILENHGILGHATTSEDVERCVLPRERWNAIADVAKAELNARLREKGLTTSRWSPGDNRVERILGTELMTLAWAAAAANETDVAAVVSAWVSLQPSERLWLAGRVLANPSADGVRKGVALLLSGGPVGADPAAKSRQASDPTTKGISSLPLFDLR